MKLRVLGSAGAELPGFRPTALLIDETLLLDAGTIASVLTSDEQLQLKAILISHAHLDHIRGIPALAENLVIKNSQNSVTLLSTREILSSVRRHIFNDVIWPDFTKIPSGAPVLTYVEMAPEMEIEQHGYSIEAIPVNHIVPSVGYLMGQNGRRMLYTGDTGPTMRIWEKAKGLTSLVMEVSFPDRMVNIAMETGHLTPCLMKNELVKVMEIPPIIYVTHLKPQHYQEIKEEIEGMHMENVIFLEEGKTYNL